MHRILYTALNLSLIFFAACNGENSKTESATETETTTGNSSNNDDAAITASSATQYIDLNTNKPIDIVWDSVNNRPLDRITNTPVDLYINTATRDTLYGPGYIVNNYVINTDGKWMLDDAKIKRDGDEIKIKKGDLKFKMEDGEWKIKGDDNKIKSDDDESKIKTDDDKIKTEDGQTKVKKDQ